MMAKVCRPVLLAAGVLLALSACRGEDDLPVGEETGATAEPPADPVVEPPVISIIRPDVAPDPVVDLPPEPLVVTIPFPEGSEIGEAAERELAIVADSDPVAEGWPIVLHGHSDSAGGDAANLTLSRRRAEAVAAWLAERGVDETRIRIVAFGEQNPAAPNARPDGTPDEEGRARNRRVEVIVSPDGSIPAREEAEVVNQGAPGTVMGTVLDR
jgi:OOP family OmpA-OmpF porin